MSSSEKKHKRKRTASNALPSCTQASEQVDKVHLFEDVSAAQGADQVIAAMLGDLISAKHVTAGIGATQRLGQMFDASLQQLSRDRVITGRAALGKAVQQGEVVPKFEDHYGAGHKLR